MLLLSFFFSISNLNAQSDRRKIIKIAPLSLADPFGSNLYIGSEFFLEENLSLEIALATYIPLDKLFYPETDIKDQYGLKLKPEIKSYFRNRAKKNLDGVQEYFSAYFVAFELFISTKKYSLGDTFVHHTGDDYSNGTTYYDYEIIRISEIGKNIKFGYQRISKSGFAFEAYFGLGLVYYNSKYIYEVEDWVCCPTMQIFPIKRIGTGFRPNMTLGIKLGLALR